MWDYFIIIYFGSYLLFVMLLIIAWYRIPVYKVTLPVDEFVSIIVPFRNEATNIQSTIEDFESQKYPITQYEVILVNDNSTDDSSSIISSRIAKSEININQIDLINEKGKKSAITYGIVHAKGRIIIVTDADCRRNPYWLSEIVGSHCSQKNDLTFGLVSFAPSKSLFSRILSLEQTSLVGSGAALWKLGVPVMMNGANMIFSKEKFLKVKGYDGNLHIPSGDDAFLLSKFSKQNFKIGFVGNKSTVVETKPPETLSGLINQRLRWAGKWRFSKGIGLRLVAVLVFLFQMGMVAAIYPLVVGKAELAYFLLGMLLKAILDFIFLGGISAKLSRRVGLLPLIILEIVYPFYVIFFALISNFKGYSWKGRKYL